MSDEDSTILQLSDARGFQTPTYLEAEGWNKRPLRDFRIKMLIGCGTTLKTRT